MMMIFIIIIINNLFPVDILYICTSSLLAKKTIKANYWLNVTIAS